MINIVTERDNKLIKFKTISLVLKVKPYWQYNMGQLHSALNPMWSYKKTLSALLLILLTYDHFSDLIGI